MADDFSELLSISLQLGRNPFWVQGPGGNTSVKMPGGKIIVKASGSELKNVSAENGFARCNVPAVNAQLKVIAGLSTHLEREVAYSDAVEKANLFPDRDKRPSMELGIHTLLPQKFVLHFHSPCALLACRAAGEDDIETPLRQSGFQVFKLSFVLPGYSLAAAILNLSLPNRTAPTVIFLQNHGVVVACDDDVHNVLGRYRAWEKYFWNLRNPPFDYEATTQREILYGFACTHECDSQPLYPDSIILEKRVRGVCALQNKNSRVLNLQNAAQDEGAADLAAVECLLKYLSPGFPAINNQAQQEIREMPAEIARTKLMQGAAK